MTAELAFSGTDFRTCAISPFQEMGAYEALWNQKGATFKRIADMFRERSGVIPSDLVSQSEASEFADKAIRILEESKVNRFGVRVHGAGEYPEKLRDAANPVELLYYQGWWDLADSRSVAIVGSRNPSEEGVRRARKLVRMLVEHDFTVVSGLAKGIDTVAHETAIKFGGRTIAVIGTPISESYPRDNRKLQNYIADEFLLVSQVPIWRYKQQDYRSNRTFFPERNKTMSALTEATVIVEASETSGTLIQARAALAQGRKLFILDSCFKNPAITWPAKYAAKGAIRVMDFGDILSNLDA